MMEPVSWRFLQDRMQGEKKLESSYGPTVKPATVATILPSQDDLQMLVINLSFLSPTSKFLKDQINQITLFLPLGPTQKPSHVSRWRTPGFPPDGSGECRQNCACMCVCVCGTEQGQGRHHVFISVTALHPTSAVQLQESLRGVFAWAGRPPCCVSLNTTWDWIRERWSVSHAHLTVR